MKKMTAVQIRILCAVSSFILVVVKHKNTALRKETAARATIVAQSCYRIFVIDEFHSKESAK